MSDTPRKTKANGHIVQADWNQTDPLQMDYIHNKPEIPSTEKLQKQIVVRNCTAETEQVNVQIDFYEPLDTDGTATNYFGVAFPISIPDQFVGQDISVSVDNIALDDVTVSSSNTSEYIGITNSKEEYFIDFEDPRCLASNDGSGWATNEVTHNVQSTSAYLMLYFVTPIPADQLDNYRYKYSDKLKLNYSIKKYTEVGDDFIYDKDLHSNLETHYEHPIDETAFQNFIMSYDQNIAQEWVIYFKAAATDIFDRFSTVNIISNNGDSNSIEVCWIGSKPKCLLNKQYKATFKLINEKLYGLLEYLEEQSIEIANPNLLLNGNFSVCQRTEGSWNTLGQYTYDRWQIWPGCTVTSGVVIRGSSGKIKLAPKVTLNNSYTNFGIIQPFRPISIQELEGKTVTLSAKISTASSALNTMYVAITDSTGTTRYKNGTAVSTIAGTILSVTLTITSNMLSNGIGCYIGFYTAEADTNVELDYVKLEVGDTYTACPPKLYEEELLACQQYYMWYNTFGNKYLGFTKADTKYCYIDFYLPTTIGTYAPRITCIDPATLAELGQIVVITSFNENLCSKYSISEITVDRSNNVNNIITVRFTVNSTSNLGANLCYLQNCPPLEIDAEIYS